MQFCKHWSVWGRFLCVVLQTKEWYPEFNAMRSQSDNKRVISINTHLSTIPAVISLNDVRWSIAMRKDRVGVVLSGWQQWLEWGSCELVDSKWCASKARQWWHQWWPLSLVEAQSTMGWRESGRMLMTDCAWWDSGFYLMVVMIDELWLCKRGVGGLERLSNTK